METQTIVIILFALLVAVLILTCVCVDGAAKAAKVRTIDREKVKAAAEHYGCRPPLMFTPEYDGALVAYIYDKHMNNILAVYSVELLEALMASNDVKDFRARRSAFEFDREPGMPHPLVIYTK